MDIRELLNLYHFSENHLRPLSRAWQNLYNGLKHNSTQSDKQPLKEHIEAVRAVLRNMPVEALSSEQLSWIYYLDVDQFIGPNGLKFLKSVLDSSTFDPVTATEDVNRAFQTVQSAEQKLQKIGEALGEYHWISDPEFSDIEDYEARFVFKNDVDVSNATDLKRASSDLYEILRGICAATDTKVEDIEIKSFAKGSMIVGLGTALVTTRILSLIVSHITGMILDSIKIRTAYEELRQRRILTRQMEQQLQAEEKKNNEEAKNELVSRLISDIGEISEENKRLLERSVDKLIEFFDKGGDLEFLEPPEPENDDEPEDAEGTVRARLKEIREHKREVLLLTNRVEDEA